MSIQQFSRPSIAGTFMLLMTVGVSFYSSDAVAYDPEQGCSDLGFSLSIAPSVSTTNGKIEIAGVPLGTEIAKLVPGNISGLCDTGYSTNPGMGDIPPGLGFLVYKTHNCSAGRAFDTDGNISMFCLAGQNTNAVLQFDGNNGPATVQPVVSATNAIFLNKKRPGETIIPMTSLADFSKFYSTWGNYDWNLKEESLRGPVTPPTLTLVYTPTCSAEVNDVAFGTISAGEIKNNRVRPGRATINVNCNDILAKYSITLSSPKGVSGDKTAILSDNTTIGYQFSWPNGAVQENIKLDQPYERNATSEAFSIPVDILPVPLPSAGAIKSGRADSVVTINLKFS